MSSKEKVEEAINNLYKERKVTWEQLNRPCDAPIKLERERRRKEHKKVLEEIKEIRKDQFFKIVNHLRKYGK